MEIQLSPLLQTQVPNFKLGVIKYENIQVGDSPQMLKGRLRLFQESLYFDLEEKSLNEFPGIKEWKKVFKDAGTDPNRYRPSVEAMFRRIKKQNYLGSINSAADINNFFSLQYQVPIGIYDLDKLKGNIEIKIGAEQDEYTGINGRVINMDKKILSRDELGAFGSPYVDSERTAVTTETTSAIQFVYLRPSTNPESAEKLVNSLKDMFIQIHGGNGQITILS